MRTILLLTPIALLAACGEEPRSQRWTPPEDTIFVAVEEDGTLAALDGASGKLVATLDLSQDGMKFDVHNVQAAPDRQTVWLTAMPAEEGGHEAHTGGSPSEQLIGVDVATFAVRDRIELGDGLHAAHVVVSSTTAYVTAYDADAVLVIDLAAKRAVSRIALPAGTGPHGARLTPDGKALVVAGMKTGALVVIDLPSTRVDSYVLPGRAVQTAVLPGGARAFVSIYDTRQVASIDLVTRAITFIDLPAGAAGPVQIYPSPDASALWVADQGMLEGQPAGDKLYRIDITSATVAASVRVNHAPHGVVVNEEGSKVWTTTLVEGTVQSVDARTGEVLSTSSVGTKPNGISCLHRSGVMP